MLCLVQCLFFRLQVVVSSDHQFVGFDAYKGVIGSGIDVVILATPPHFRPAHLQYAVEKGKHSFVEKPVAVDAPGVRSMFATCELAKQKGLAVVSGLCWRYHPGMRATFARVLNGAIGEVIAIQATYLTQTLKKFPPMQAPESYNLSQVMAQIKAGGGHPSN